MKAGDVMTRDVISVDPDASVMQAIRLMLQNRISGLPVIDGKGRLVGMITEGDLLRRGELGTQRHRPRWLEFLIGPGRLASEYVHACGRKVHEAMTADVYTAGEDMPLDEVVSLMERRRIKRLPIVGNEKVTGIVTRANLMRALASVAREMPPGTADDAAIRDHLLATVKGQPWGPGGSINVIVKDGTVQLWGSILDDRLRKALMVAAENTPGVKGIEDHLLWVEPVTGFVIGPDASVDQARGRIT